MKLENQVCSLELAKQLKELGVKQESLYFWCQQEGQNPGIIPKAKAKRILSWHKEIVSAFTVAELGEMLPDKLANEEYLALHCIKTRKMSEEYKPIYKIFFAPAGATPKRIHEQNAFTEADARAKILIYLLKNNLLQNKT
jgi:hypothetical protein